MTLIDDDKLRLLCGKPLIFKDICLVYSPILEDIISVGLSKFYKDISLLLIEKPSVEEKEVNDVLKNLSDFEYLLLICSMEPETKKMLEEAFYLFTQDSIIISLETSNIILGDPSEKRILTKDNFYDFQTYIGLACAMEDYSEEPIEFLDTDSPKVRELKLQMLEGRKKRKELKEKQKKSDKSTINFSDLVASLPIGTSGYTLQSVMKLSYYAFQDQLKRMGWHEEFNINTRAAMAGAKIGKDKLSHWIKTMTFK